MCSIRGVKIGIFPSPSVSDFSPSLDALRVALLVDSMRNPLPGGSGTFRKEGIAEACFLCQVGGVFLGQESGMQVSFPNITSRFRVIWKR